MARPLNALGQGREEKPAPPAYQYAEYPAARYNTKGGMRIVHSKEEDEALGPEFSKTEFRTASDGDEQEQAAEPCESCVRLTIEKADAQARFEIAWRKKTEEVDALNLQVESLVAANEALAIDLKKKAPKLAAAA